MATQGGGKSKGITRRDFMKGATIGGASLATMGMFGGVVASTAAAAETESTWRTPPDPISDSQIVATHSADVIVVGHGYGGLCCCREVAESGKSVILIDQKSLASYSPMGNEGASLNSKELKRRGMPYVDPIDFFNNFMMNVQCSANPTLVMKFCQNSGKTFDWYYDRMTKSEKNALTVGFWPRTVDRRQNMLGKIGQYKFWGLCLTGSQSKLHAYNRQAAKDAGAKFYFSMTAQQLVQADDGTITGVVAKNADGEYVKFTGTAIVLATGGFAANQEMLKDLCSDIENYFITDRDAFSNVAGMDYQGDGIKMAYWAGAKLESAPIPTMDGRVPWQKGLPARVNSVGYPQGLWLDYQGNRFCNEFFGTIEHRTRPTLVMDRSKFWAFYDYNLPTRLEYVSPSHGSVDPLAATLDGVKATIDNALAAGSAGYADSNGSQWFAANTIDELVGYVCSDSTTAANIKASIARYNKMCTAGRDDDFGREPKLLFPVKKAPYVCAPTDNLKIGTMLCTMGGLIPDYDQKVLGDDFKPIQGLFATGNVTGSRFGNEYISPSPGVSIGFAITLGRECGRSVVEWLDSQS